MGRLTRAQSQERTRQLLVEAATRLFWERGFTATPLEVIAEEAGFSRGAVYSNFASKTEIGHAVLDQVYEQVTRAAATAASSATPGNWVSVVLGPMETCLGDPQWTRLEVEVAAAGAQESDLEAFRQRYARLRQSCEAMIREALGDNPAVDPGRLSLLLVSSLLGAGLQRAVDQSISFEEISGAMGLLGRAITPA
jgi:AcrR family transcriptional regulator